jgi:hypothetical protein
MSSQILDEDSIGVSGNKGDDHRLSARTARASIHQAVLAMD